MRSYKKNEVKPAFGGVEWSYLLYLDIFHGVEPNLVELVGINNNLVMNKLIPTIIKGAPAGDMGE